MNKDQAEQRVTRIQAFREELSALAAEKMLLPADQQENINKYHDLLLQDLVSRFDVDISAGQRQMSLGMRLVSFLGALAISCAVFFFFYRFWGNLTTTAQVGILVAGPLLATMVMELAARKEKTLYFANLAGLVALTCFILNLTLLGTIFNIIPSQNAFLVWAGFALLLAYTYQLRLMLVAGIICLFGYLSATAGTFCGCYWLSFGERPENFIIAGLIIFAIPFGLPHRSLPQFPPYYRIFGLLPVFIAILILTHWGHGSYLPFSAKPIEYIYQVAAFTVAGLTIWLGIKKRWPGVTNLGSTFFVIYLYTKLYDWWWDWMPKYLFFLVLGLLAILLLLVLKRLHRATGEAAR